MNWWSAFTWCEAIGGKLASFESMCPGNQINPVSTCPNLKGTGISNVRSSTAWNTGNYLGVESGGQVKEWSRNDTHGAYKAFCEQK